MVLPRLCVALLACVLVTACAETTLLVHGAKEISRKDDSGAKSSGYYKVGTPYQIAGTWYYPAENLEYAETGIASWYGPQFDGKQTANGEVFDMNALSAAHRTLPMPSVVRVVNLENGRSLIVRVNDRGPFARGRIIDMSRRAAQILGFQRNGTARVRVEVVPDESRRLKQLAMSGAPLSEQTLMAAAAPSAAPQVPPAAVQASAPAAPPGRPVIQSVSLPAPTGDNAAAATPPARPSTGDGTAAAAGQGSLEQVVARGPVTATRLFVQAGAFTEYANASRVRSTLSAHGPAWVSETQVGSQKFFRVRVGPLNTVARADDVLEQVVSSGFPQAHIIVD
ncbi:MAG: septal ring lytic transglycosylase RlpA family protein [Rhodospirillaceae bacterium]